MMERNGTVFGGLDVSTSGMIAQRTRLAVISSNIANSGTILNSAGEYEPYRRRIVGLAQGDPSNGSEMGVRVSEIRLDDAPLRPRYEPGSPYADESGYVRYPNVSSAAEQVDAVEAMRAYEANVAAAEATKTMMGQALRLIA